MEGDWVCTACGITNDGSGWFDAGRICNPSPVPCYACGAVHIVTYRLDVTVCSEQALADEVRATVEAMHSANANDGDEDETTTSTTRRRRRRNDHDDETATTTKRR